MVCWFINSIKSSYIMLYHVVSPINPTVNQVVYVNLVVEFGASPCNIHFVIIFREFTSERHPTSGCHRLLVTDVTSITLSITSDVNLCTEDLFLKLWLFFLHDIHFTRVFSNKNYSPTRSPDNIEGNIYTR